MSVRSRTFKEFSPTNAAESRQSTEITQIWRGDPQTRKPPYGSGNNRYRKPPVYESRHCIKDTSPAVIRSRCDSGAWSPSRTGQGGNSVPSDHGPKGGLVGRPAGCPDREEEGIGTGPGLWQNRAIHAGVLCLKYARSAASGL